jgi:hypothetical protein
MGPTAVFCTSGDRVLRRFSVICGILFVSVSVACNPPSDGEDASFTPGQEVVSQVAEPLPPNASLRDVLQHRDTLERIKRTAEILQRSGPEDLEKLIYEFENAAHERGDYAYGLFGHWWARFDPESAYMYADTQLRFDQPSVILQVVRAWAQQDPIGALESSLLNSTGSTAIGMREELTDAFVVGWFEAGDRAGGEQALVNWIVTQQDGAAIQRGLRAYARMRVLRDGDQQTLDWIRTEPYEPVVNRLLLAGALTVIAHQNPKLASEWLPVAEADGIDIRSFTARIARSWAHHDPRAAVDWVMTTPESGERNAAISAIGRRWMRRDGDGFADWLATVHDAPWTDPLRNMAIRFYVRDKKFHVDWSQLVDRASKITDPKQKVSLMTWLMQRWFVADLEQANQWVVSNPDAVPEDYIARARKIAPKTREQIERELSGILEDWGDEGPL